MPSEPWEIADLLDQIAQHADPFSVARRFFAQFLGNVRTAPSSVVRMFAPDHERKWLVVTHMIPLSTAMQGVAGTAEDVLEWARTGLRDCQKIDLTHSPMGERVFAVTQVFKDSQVYDDYMEMHYEFGKRVMRRIGPE